MQGQTDESEVSLAFALLFYKSTVKFVGKVC